MITALLEHPETRKRTKRAKLDDSDSDFDIELFDDFGRRSCEWDEDLCTEEATYRVVFKNLRHGDGEKAVLEPTVYCARHYAAWLAKWVVFHDKQCIYSAQDHLASYGRIGA